MTNQLYVLTYILEQSQIRAINSKKAASAAFWFLFGHLSG